MVTIAVIGAGAAGISAARALVAAGHTVTVFEARDRLGGRTHTDYAIAPHPVELGAEFIHGERVRTWSWVRELGVPVTGAAHAYEMWFHLGGKLLDRAQATADFGTDPMTAVDELSRLWVEEGRPEASLDQALTLWPRLSEQPLTAERRRLLANHMAELAASDLEALSTGRARRPMAGPPETLRHFRLLAGYADLVARAAVGLDIRPATPVRRVRWDERGVELTMDAAVERFDATVVAVPLGVLRRGVVVFDPPLPPEKQRAVDGLNAGNISKVVLRFDRVPWPPDLTFLWTPLSSQLWWRPGQGQINEAPVLTAFFGGRDAAALEGATEAEAIDEATRQLGDILGESLAGKTRAGRYIAWGREPWTWMGYSTLPVGGQGMREALAAPAGSLHFAGEATSRTAGATVHGAIESGERAAREIDPAIGREDAVNS